MSLMWENHQFVNRIKDLHDQSVGQVNIVLGDEFPNVNEVRKRFRMET